MSVLLLRWRVPPPPIVTRWRGPAGVLDAVARSPLAPLTGFVVSSADGGDVTAGEGIEVVGSEIRVDIDSLPTAP